MKQILREHKGAITICFIFLLIYSSISFVNHYFFRTFALDLGMFNHALYAFSKGKEATYLLGVSGIELPYFATHFSPLLIIFSPFRYIFGSYTLLIFQILAILFGGLGIYKYVLNELGGNKLIARVILVQFLSIWGIFSALSFDFHMNVIGVMLLPWFVLFFEKNNTKLTILVLTGILLSIETMSLWMLFIIMALILKNRKSISWKTNKTPFILLSYSVIVGIVILNFIMPYYQHSSTNLQFDKYADFGKTPFDMIKKLCLNPLNFLQLFFGNTIHSEYDGIKLETILMLLFSGGLVILIRPIYTIMLLPILAQKFMSNEYVMWGINNQYSIEFVPILSLALIDLIKFSKKYKLIIAVIMMAVTIVATISTINHRKSKWYSNTNTNFLHKKHYQSNLNGSKIYKALDVINESDVVSTVSILAPHLAFRDRIYHFPNVKNANCIVLLKNSEFSYPLSIEDYNVEISKLRVNKSFYIAYEDDEILIFKMKEH